MNITNKQVNRFLDKVKKTSRCWFWKGATIKNGYGRVTLGKKQYLAHRIAFSIFKGLIPDGNGYHGVCVMHSCDNRLCVNPNHLSLGSQKDNVKDSITKSRHYTPNWSGKNNPNYGGILSTKYGF